MWIKDANGELRHRRCPDCGTTDSTKFAPKTRRISRCRVCAGRRKQEWYDEQSKAGNNGKHTHARETNSRRCRRYKDILLHRKISAKEKAEIFERVITEPRF